MMTHAGLAGQPRAFARAVQEVEDMIWRPQVAVREIPAPQRIAPYSFAIEADVLTTGGGRLVLLYAPDGSSAWDGDFRCVSYARADVTHEIGKDELIHDVGWSWLIEALASRDAHYLAEAGTVTTVGSKAFGEIAGQSRHEVEIRASWTPLVGPDGSGLASHLRAWEDLLCHCAGLPPIPAGVTMLGAHRR